MKQPRRTAKAAMTLPQKRILWMTAPAIAAPLQKKALKMAEALLIPHRLRTAAQKKIPMEQ